MWFIASTAWADRLNSMGTYLDPYKIIRDDLGVLCTQNGKQICTAGEAGSHATLVVSVVSIPLTTNHKLTIMAQWLS